MKRALILPALLLLSACGDTPQDSLAKARAAYSANDYGTARIHLAAGLTQTPGDRDMLLLQARTLLALGDGEGAGAALDKLVGSAPRNEEIARLSAEAALLRGVPRIALDFIAGDSSAEAERLRALAAIQRRDVAQAGALFERGLAAGGNARLFADYARFRLMNGDIAGARELAVRAAQAAPDGIDTLLVSAQIAVRQGDLGKALGQYERAGKLYPASLAALVGKAAVLGDLGRDDEMQRAVAQAVALAPRNPSVVFLAARAAQVRKDWAGLRDLVQPVEATLPQVDPLRQLYGEALLRLGRNELAIAQLQPIARAMPGNRDAVRLLAEAQLASGDARAAGQVLAPLASHPAALPGELALMARIARANGDAAGAAGYEARTKQPPVQALGRDLVDADAAMRAGNWAGAVQAYRQVQALTDGRNVMVLNNLAYAQLQLGNHAEALKLADQALKLAPDNPSVLDTAGYARLRSGQALDEARRLLRRAAEQAPDNPAIRAHLAEAERAAG